MVEYCNEDPECTNPWCSCDKYSTSLLENIFDTEPFTVNERGTKWWPDKHTTDYARREDAYGTSLDVHAWYVETEDGIRSRVLTDKVGVIAEDQQLDGIGTKIDMLKMLQRFDEAES